jgi:glycine oxidase
MLLYRTAERLFEPVVNVGNRYLVPREDGFLLAGSTMEEVGFDDGVTAEARRELMELTQRLVPSLRDVAPERQWSGLRPATFDGLPYIGAVPNWPQAWIATGLFRVGLQAAPAVAHIIASLIDQETPPIDIQPFRPGRLSLK